MSTKLVPYYGICLGKDSCSMQISNSPPTQDTLPPSRNGTKKKPSPSISACFKEEYLLLAIR